MVIRAHKAFIVADHVSDPNSESTTEPSHQGKAGVHLMAIPKDLRIAEPDVFDADSSPVQADRVPAQDADRDQLVNRSVLVDDEVRTRTGKLVQLAVRRVWSERVVGRSKVGSHGVVDYDHV